jgi:hypothetical protein
MQTATFDRNFFELNVLNQVGIILTTGIVPVKELGNNTQSYFMAPFK